MTSSGPLGRSPYLRSRITASSALVAGLVLANVAATASELGDAALRGEAESFVSRLLGEATAIASFHLDSSFVRDDSLRTVARRAAAPRDVPAVGGDSGSKVESLIVGPKVESPTAGPKVESLIVRLASSAQTYAVSAAVSELEALLRPMFDWSTMRRHVVAGLEYELGYIGLSARELEGRLSRRYARVLNSVLYFYTGREQFAIKATELHPNGDVTVSVVLSNPSIRPQELRVRLKPGAAQGFLILDFEYRGRSVLRLAREDEFELWLAQRLPAGSFKRGTDQERE